VPCPPPLSVDFAEDPFEITDPASVTTEQLAHEGVEVAALALGKGDDFALIGAAGRSKLAADDFQELQRTLGPAQKILDRGGGRCGVSDRR